MIQYTDQLPGRTVRLEGEEYLYFSGTSYLGMARNEAFAELLREGIARYGSNYSSSRGGNLQLAIYEEAETYLGRLTGALAALTVSSGMQAGQLVIKTLPGSHRFLYGPRTHPALWRSEEDGYEGDWHEWSARLPALIHQMPEKEIVILTNTLDPLQAEAYSFEWLTHLPTTKHITLVADDSHGLGVTGNSGGGIYRQLATFPHIQPIVIASMGKALGLPGGVILGKELFIKTARDNAFFGGASPVPPAYLHAFLKAAHLYEEARKKLLVNISHFAQVVQETALFQHILDYPVFYTPANQLYAFLKEKKIFISSFPYPTPASDAVTRVVVSSLHREADMAYLGECVKAFAAQRL